MMQAITKTDFRFPGQKNVYKGKVRDVYNIDNKYLVMIVTDRISAFDVVLPRGIPYKGQVLNQIASKFWMLLLILFPTVRLPPDRWQRWAILQNLSR
jgi:phosphoribosylaminoimidazole-succinocarboxamide synthase